MNALGWAAAAFVAAVIGHGIVDSTRNAIRRADLEAGRRSGRYPTRWTDKNRWEK